jgi:tetratricopeptide (TPR) repeat protein
MTRANGKRTVGRAVSASIEAWERTVAQAFEAGREPCLRALVRLHPDLHRCVGPLARALGRLYLTALVADSPVGARAHERAGAATRTFLASGLLDWASRALAQEGRLRLLTDDWSGAAVRLARACELAGRTSPPPWPHAQMWRNLGEALWRLGDVEGAREAWEEALTLADRHALGEIAAAAHVGIGLCLWVEGAAAAGYVHASTALNWYRRARRPREVAQVLYNAALMLEEFGLWHDATVLLGEARDLARAAADRRRWADASVELAHAWLVMGDEGEALAELDTAHSIHATGEPLDRRRRAELLVVEGHTLLRRHLPEFARERLALALQTAGEDRPRLSRGLIGVLGRLARSEGGRAEAVSEMMEEIGAMAVEPAWAQPLAAAGRRAGP